MENNLIYQDYNKPVKWEDLKLKRPTKVKLGDKEGIVTCSKIAGVVKVELALPDDTGKDFIIKFDEESKSIFNSLCLIEVNTEVTYLIILEDKGRNVKEVMSFNNLAEALWEYGVFIKPRPHFFNHIVLQKVDEKGIKIIKQQDV